MIGLLVAVSMGCTVGAGAWAYSQKRSREDGLGLIGLPTWVGAASGCMGSLLAWFIAPAEALAYCPIAAFLCVAIVTDIVERRVYHPLPLLAVAWATATALLSTHDLWRIAPVLVFGFTAVGIVLAVGQIGGADAIAVALLAALFGWSAWVLVLLAFVVMGLAILPARRRGVEYVPGYVGFGIAAFVGMSGAAQKVIALYV